MKKFTLRKDEHTGRKSGRDLLVADVVFDNGSVGTSYLTRASAEVKTFEFAHIGKVMTAKDFEDYASLVRAEIEVERSFEEE